MELHLEDGTPVEITEIETLRILAERQQIVILVIANDTVVAENFITYAMGMHWPHARAVKTTDCVYIASTDGSCAVLLDSALSRAKDSALAVLRQRGVPFIAPQPLEFGIVAPAVMVGETVDA